MEKLNFWDREGALAICFLVFFGAWFVVATTVNCLIEIYMGVLGLSEPTTWLDTFSTRGKPAGEHWPDWAWRVPTVIVLVVYPTIFLLDAFGTTLRQATRRWFR